MYVNEERGGDCPICGKHISGMEAERWIADPKSKSVKPIHLQCLASLGEPMDITVDGKLTKPLIDLPSPTLVD